MFYELQNSLHTDLFKIERGNDFSFPLHLHDSFELIVVTSGEMYVTVDKNKYFLKKGDAVLVFPNQLHELITDEHSSHFLCIFSSKLVQTFSKMRAQSVPSCNAFNPRSFYIDQLMSFSGGAEGTDLIRIKGILYTICGEFDTNATYVEQTSRRDNLLSVIFRFVDENYKNDCTLRALSASTSYNYVYLSRFFKESTKIAFIDYVNRYRIDEACYLLRNSNQSILQIAYDCGFDSLRTFNRNFKKTVGVTPSEYQNV